MKLFYQFALFCICSTGHLCSEDRNSDITYPNLPESWQKSYDRLNRFIATKKEYWPNSHLIFSSDGSFDFSLTNNELNSRLALNLDELGARGGGWQLERVVNSVPDSLNDRSIRLNPGIYAASMRTLGKFNEPIVWFEVKYSEKASVSRKLASDRVFHEIPPPRNPKSLWPNVRINYFVDLHASSNVSAKRNLFERNKIVTPSATLLIRNDGVIERELFKDPKYEAIIRWYIYKNNELIVKQPAEDQNFIEINHGYGTYRAFLCYEGPEGILPVSNILRFPLFPDNQQLYCIPKDSNNNQLPDVIEAELNSQRKSELYALWNTWRYHLRNHLNQNSMSTSDLIVQPAP